MENLTSTQLITSANKPLFTREGSKSLTYTPAIDLDFVERLLGKKQENELSRTTVKRLAIQKNRLLKLIKPRLSWREFTIAEVDKTGVILTNNIKFKSRKMAHALRGAEKIIGFIATVGSKIDREVASLITYGELAHGYIADALGSGAVENLANRFHTGMAKKVAGYGQSVGLRFSPGYCDWHVTEQQKLFSIIDHDAVGVDLGETSLMAPRKSISAVFGIFERNETFQDISNHNPCRFCAKKDCIARRVEAVPPLSH